MHQAVYESWNTGMKNSYTWLRRLISDRDVKYAIKWKYELNTSYLFSSSELDSLQFLFALLWSQGQLLFCSTSI